MKNPLEIIDKSINNNKELVINNINIKNIIIFFYYYYFYNNNEIQEIDASNNNFDYIKVIFGLNKILNLYLTKESDFISCQNYFNYLFNKHFFAIKKISPDKNNFLFSKLLNTFLQLLKDNEIDQNESKNNTIYENFLYIIYY